MQLNIYEEYDKLYKDASTFFSSLDLVSCFSVEMSKFR